MSSDRKIPFASKLAFGVGQTAEGLKNTAFAAFTLLYFHQVREVPAALVGLAGMIALVFDAVTDPMAGSLSDRTHSRLGRRHPYMYASAIPLGVCFYLLFSPPESLGTMGLFWWLLTFSILTRAAMTLYHVPHLALGAELTENFVDRTSIVAYRQVFNAVGLGLTYALGFGYFLSDARGGRTNIDAFEPLALVLGIGMTLTVFYSAWGTRQEIPHLPQPVQSSRSQVRIHRLIGDAFVLMLSQVASAFRNGSFRWLFSGVLVVYLMVGVDAVLNTHIGNYFWELSGAELFALGVSVPVGLFAGAFFTRGLHQRFGKRAGLVFGTAGWATCQTLPVILRLVGWFPENDSPLLLPLLIAFRVLQGAIVQQATVSFGSMMADVADEHELESGQRQEGIFFGAVAFSNKFATGIGTLIAGVGLSLISWPSGAEIQSAADVPAATLFWLGMLFGPIVCGFAVVSVWCYNQYQLDSARHREILAELAKVRPQRRAAAAAAIPVVVQKQPAQKLEPSVAS